jgi:Na+:H+ antiporter, NhaC family
MSTVKREASLFEALLPIIFLISALALNVIIYGADSTYGPNQIALILAAMAGVLVALRLGYSWTEMEGGMVSSISSAMAAILILLLIGALAGTWLLSGIVPAMIYYGLKILNPGIFLFAACFVCAVVSLATGSSWSTVATVGIALLGIGKTLGFHEGIIAGAIISGAYFGDKMSPLSDTTNLAPAMAGTDLFTHIRHMVYTTVPAISIALILFLVIGLMGGEKDSPINEVQTVLDSIDTAFNISPFLFLVPGIVIFMIIKKMPAFPALLIGTLLGGVTAVIFQPQAVQQVSGITNDWANSSYQAVLKAMYTKISLTTDNAMVNELLTTRGMEGMLNTIWLIICAMMFGGVMEASGLLERITKAIIGLAKSTGSLIASTLITCGILNITASDQYLAIVVPGRMFRKVYRDRGLKPENLSRALEDSGTVTSVLVPWNTCGATQATVLGVATGTYLPYCFFNILSPLISMAYGFLGITITKLEENKDVKKPVVGKGFYRSSDNV